jgi:hypothetical protein
MKNEPTEITKMKSVLKAYARIIKILRPFTDEKRERIIRSAAILLGIDKEQPK